MHIIMDVLLVGVILFATYSGYKKGFLATLTRTIALFLAVVIAAALHKSAASIFNLPPILANILAFILVFLLSLLFFKLVSFLITRVFKGSKVLKKTNAFLGMILGFVLGIFYAWVISVLFGAVAPIFAGDVVGKSIVLEFFYSYNPLTLLNIFIF